MMSLRTLLFVALAVGFTSASNCDQKVRANLRMFEDIINGTMNTVIQSISDPLVINSIPITLPGGLLEGGMNITDLDVEGIHSIVASQISLSILQLRLDMTVDVQKININLKYWADMLIGTLIPLYGEGKMNINFENIQLKIAGAANLTGGISVKDVSVALTVGSATFDLHGLLNDEEFSAIVSKILNDNLVPFIDDNSEIISNIISPIIEGVINNILKPKSEQVREIVDLICNEN